jgi:hypothetical protein
MTVAEGINVLLDRACRCGAAKLRKTAFCQACYGALPMRLRRALWRKLGRGFEEAYQAAVEWLEEAEVAGTAECAAGGDRQ